MSAGRGTRPPGFGGGAREDGEESGLLRVDPGSGIIESKRGFRSKMKAVGARSRKDKDTGLLANNVIERSSGSTRTGQETVNGIPRAP